MAESSIEWTDCTWNPVAGCTIVSPGCTNCYAMRLAARLERMGVEKYVGTTRRSGDRTIWTGRVRLDEGALAIPLSWRRPKRIFVNSMSDLFHEDIPLSFVEQVWSVMERANWHSFQVLTKRPERMQSMFSNGRLRKLPNVWLGTSVENSDFKHRIAVLRGVPAAVRFLSIEPLLGPIGKLNLRGIHWVIVGGESGPSARPIEAGWVDDIRSQCENAGVPFFFKQWGGTNKKKTGRQLDGRTWDQFPAVGVSAFELV
jgi:protein gp37